MAKRYELRSSFVLKQSTPSKSSSASLKNGLQEIIPNIHNKLNKNTEKNSPLANGLTDASPSSTQSVSFHHIFFSSSSVLSTFSECDIFTEKTDTQIASDNLPQSETDCDLSVMTIVAKYVNVKDINMTDEEIRLVHAFVTNRIGSKLCGTFFNKDTHYVLGLDEHSRYWKRCCCIEISKIKKYFPKNIRKCYIKYLYKIIYLNNLSQQYEKCEILVRKKMEMLYKKLEENADESTRNLIIKQYKIVCNRFGKIDVQHAMKRVRLQIQNNLI